MSLLGAHDLYKAITVVIEGEAYADNEVSSFICHYYKGNVL